MPRLMRKRLLCFYCGGRSTQEYLPTIRLWECEICDATNHLDEQGEITEPPALDSLPHTRYAQPIPRPVSPEFAPPDESLFCQTCLQNQKFLTESLASYFPPSHDPEHPEYEKTYPEFRKNLEDRYPQVCRKCEPRVRNRIRITGYAAKTDHLRRMMERSRNGDRNYHRWTWTRLAFSAGALGWYTSIAGQLMWNLIGALASQRDEGKDGLIDDTTSKLTSLGRSWISGQACSQQLDALARLALGLGLVSIWWNPRFKERLDRGSGRLLGLMEYYKLQFIFLIIRFGSYTAITRSIVNNSEETGTRKAIHFFMIMFTMISIFISFRSVQIDLAPRVLFQGSDAPLIPESEGIQESTQRDQPQPGHRQLETPEIQSAVQSRPFSLHYLAPDHSRSRALPHNPPTPPPDEDGVEEMDWTPSQQPLPPPSKYQMPVPNLTQPSPFYGHLPPAPISPAHRLRNPPQRLAFQKATATPKQGFFGRHISHLEPDNTSEASTIDSPIKSINKSRVASPQMAQPRFFYQSPKEMDTGLESIFSKAFSLAEEPSEVRAARENKQKSPDGHVDDGVNPKVQVLSYLTLALSIIAWLSAPKMPHWGVRIRLACLGVAAIVAGRGLLETVRKGKVYWRWSDMFVYGFELCLATFLGRAIQLPLQKGNTDEVSLAGVVFLGAMFLQELWIWISKLGKGVTVVGEPNTRPPTEQPVLESSSPKEENQSDSKAAVVARPSSPVMSQRTTRSETRRREKNIAASNGLGGLSLGGDGAGMGALTVSSRGNDVRSRRKW